MKIKLHYLILIFALCIVSIHSQGQNLTEFDKEQIVRRAKLKIDEFEELLFLISDPTRSRGAVNRYILSSYSREDSLFNQVFYNEKVMIEDDLSPVALTRDDIEVSPIDVVAYLNSFKLQYDKYVEKTMFFTDLSFSEVMQEDYVYVVASYLSEFRGRNINFKDLQYQAVRRKATLRAEYNYETDAWQVWIAGVNFDRADLMINENVSTIEKEPLEEVKPDTTAVQTDKLSEKTKPVESQDMEKEKTGPALQFSSAMPASIKKGENIALKWNRPVDDASLSLYQSEQEITKLRQGLSGQQWNWNIQQKPGKKYSIVLYDPAADMTTRSEQFRIKPRFPLAVKVGIPVALAAYLVYAKQKEIFPFEEKPPPGSDLTIDIRPRVPGND